MWKMSFGKQILDMLFQRLEENIFINEFGRWNF